MSKKPTEPKCTVASMQKVVRRNSDISEDDLKPEHKLILAIIGGAISDLTHKNYHTSAERFLKGDLFKHYCGLVGLDPSATVHLLRQGGFLK